HAARQFQLFRPRHRDGGPGPRRRRADHRGAVNTKRLLLPFLVLSAVWPCPGQRRPAPSPASPRDSMRAAWSPERIISEHMPNGLDSAATIQFHNGRRFVTGLYDVKFLGLLPSRAAPYVVLSGRGCQECDANISIYVLSPLGPRVFEATTTRY